MMSSGQFAVTDGGNETRIHPAYIEVNGYHVVTEGNINYYLRNAVTPSAVREALGIPDGMNVVYDGGQYSHLSTYIRHHIPARYRTGL
ncbi:hypothetical protein [Lactobacillus helveticus]|nr:hypothetical protein [Lactobacillus helveticus]